MIDGCATGSGQSAEHPLRLIVDRFGDNHGSVSHLILTHPHADHVYGFVELIEQLAPRYIGVTGPDPRQNLVRELSLVPATEATSALQRRGRVLTALARVQAWSEAHPDRLCSLSSGVRLQLHDADDIEVVACAPDAVVLSRWWGDGTLPGVIQHNANALSVVLELRWGTTQLLLGGDLPSSGETGWQRVHATHPSVAQPHVLKVPHHGSRASLHEPVLSTPHDGAAWLVTPFSPSDLPRADDEDGLDQLLGLQSPILLTALSMSRRLQAAIERHEVEADELPRLVAALRCVEEGSSWTNANRSAPRQRSVGSIPSGMSRSTTREKSAQPTVVEPH